MSRMSRLSSLEILTYFAVLVTFHGPAAKFQTLDDLKMDSITTDWITIGSPGRNPEVLMNTTELITSKGYPCENYEVLTEDGYILTISRIPHGKKKPCNTHYNSEDIVAEGMSNDSQTGGSFSGSQTENKRPVVLLQHGLLGSADDWLLNLADQSLGFVLADSGADVWLANSRGNIYSRGHTKFTPHDLDFWKFSWDEIARYDLPAIINFALNTTGQSQLYYVGHSQGSTIGFVQFGEDPNLGSKVKHFMALAPIARIGHTKSPIRFMAPFASGVDAFLDIFGHGEFAIPKTILRKLAVDVCQKWGILICENVVFVFNGFDYHHLNSSRVEVYMSHDPAGTSSRVLLQWAQSVKSRRFQRFDHGEEGNMKKYGQKTPPEYDPQKVKVPVAIFRGGRDRLADNDDVDWLMKRLKVTHDINIPFYEHLDMAFAFDAVKYMYQDIIKIVMGSNACGGH